MPLAPLLVLYLVVGALAQPGSQAVRDEPALLAAAERLVEHGRLAGTGTDPDQRAYLWHGPGVVVLLAPLVALEAPLWATRLTSPLLMFCAVVLFHRLLRLRLPARPALAWAYALGLYAPFVIVLGTLQKEPAAIALVAGAMLALARVATSGGLLAAVTAGLALAGLAMVRLEYGWVILALLAAAAVSWARGRTPRAIALPRLLAAVVAALACAPWLLFTYARTGQPLYWSSSSGLSLFWMSPTLPGRTGQWHSPVRVFQDPELAAYRPLFRRLDEVHPLRSDLELRRRAAENVRERPLLYVRNLVANAGRLLVFWPTRPGPPAGELAMLLVVNGSLLAAVGWSARRLWRRRRSLPPEVAPFALFAALGVAVHLPPSASPRMLLPLVPIAIWLVAIAVARGDGDWYNQLSWLVQPARRPSRRASMRRCAPTSSPAGTPPASRCRPSGA